MSDRRSISILDATGSVGGSTLDLIRRDREAWDVVALTAHTNVNDLARLAREFTATIVTAPRLCEYAMATLSWIHSSPAIYATRRPCSARDRGRYSECDAHVSF